MKAIQRLTLGVAVRYESGTDASAAAEVAASSDVAIVFATEYMSESVDALTRSLPDGPTR
jgi:beta-glucosidase